MNSQTIVLGGGCFWCIEALYRRLEGILDVESGYAGGSTPDPDYRTVCSGTTGHAEVVRVTFDADTIRLEDVLDFFWKAHDPTTLNRQGADAGTQYRSVVFYTDEEQRDVVERSRDKAASLYRDPVVTQVEPLDRFYPAEDYHQEYYETNPRQGYCRLVIEPKLKKLGFDSAPRR